MYLLLPDPKPSGQEMAELQTRQGREFGRVFEAPKGFMRNREELHGTGFFPEVLHRAYHRVQEVDRCQRESRNGQERIGSVDFLQFLGWE